MEIKKNEPLKNHTSFKIGGPAEEFAEAKSTEDVISLIEYAKEKGIPYMIMGNGSNLLVSDKGVKGLVIKISKGFDKVEIVGEKVIAEAGILLSKLSNIVADKELSGMEEVSGIPGTLGGGIYMNAGAYGGELKDVVERVTYFSNGEIKVAEKGELDFGYRHSRFTGTDDIILSAELSLKKGDIGEIREKMADFKERRCSKQPLSMPSAGSTFKRPEGYFAGKLIEDAELKGFSIGGAQVSEKHSGFVVNTGDAKFGVKLETEVKLVGEF